jgi:ribosomal protein S18 acetylase RimI-like enzyme
VIDPTEAASAFDVAFSARGPAGYLVRPERDDDEGFLRALFLASFPLRDMLPAPMLAQQADFQFAAFRNNYPGAMRRIVADAEAPVGRIVIDWSGQTSHCVDVAVHPRHGGRGIGTALLQAWIDASARQGLACTLLVAPDNPARALYARLGFRETPGEPGGLDEVGVPMLRPSA